jgi:signal transduction histidine kinase
MAEPSIRLLLIDDDEDDALLTRELLEDASSAGGQRYQLVWKDSYQAGLEAVLEGGFDLALVDQNLKPGQGHELMAQARAAGCRTPFLLLTGLDDDRVDQRAMEAGALDFLIKGRTDGALLERSIRYALRHHATLEALAQRSGQLERSNAELEQFARAISHDLRQPLHVIAGYIELLVTRYQGSLDEKALDLMSRITHGVERMNRLIEDLLALSAIGAQSAEPVPVDLDACLDAVLETLEPTIAAAGASIERSALAVVPGRRAHLEQLFRNLLNNALKFRGAEPPRIAISCTKAPGHWRLEVSDNGIGVPETHRETIFQPFARAHVDHQVPGTGVGLALCAKIVQQHGGRIWVEPAQPRGSRFQFTLRR